MQNPKYLCPKCGSSNTSPFSVQWDIAPAYSRTYRPPLKPTEPDYFELISVILMILFLVSLLPIGFILLGWMFFDKPLFHLLFEYKAIFCVSIALLALLIGIDRLSQWRVNRWKKKAYPEYERELAIWQKSHICLTCGHTFLVDD